MQAQNTVSVGRYNFVVKGKNKPFGNNFVVKNAKLVQYNGMPEIACVVVCTANSMEPGREYFVQYNVLGRLQECYTVN